VGLRARSLSSAPWGVRKRALGRLAPPLLKAACASARRYAKFDICGLAAGLATSWAALAESSPELLHDSLAHDVLFTCARLLDFVRLPPVLRAVPGHSAQAAPWQAARDVGGRSLV